MPVVKSPSTQLGLDRLESREVPTVTAVNVVGSTLNVFTDNSPTSVRVYSATGGTMVYEAGTGASWTHAGVTRVCVYGGEGSDDFRNYAGSLPVTFVGRGGNDRLDGGNGGDTLDGGAGDDAINGAGGNDHISGGANQDRLKGMSGDDTIWGDDGHDVLAGGTGNDTLHGGNGNDSVIGGNGTDTMNGNNGDDSLVALDSGTTDTADGQAGNDSLWLDETVTSWFFDIPLSTATDAGTGERVHRVRSFANGTDRTLDGDAVGDPTDGTFYKNFADRPLFAVGGPLVDDVDQQSSADCWLLAPLGSLAHDNQAAVRHMVADFGDGTYGVKLGDRFYRVDADLPTWSAASTDQVFAGLGTEGSLWVALVEKAYAMHRTGANTYASLGWGWAEDALRAYNLSGVSSSYFARGGLPGNVANSVFDHWNAFQSCTICTGAVSASSGLVGSHCYSVVGVWREAATNKVTNILVRNPWGGDDTGGNPFVWLTPLQLAECDITVAWGNS